MKTPRFSIKTKTLIYCVASFVLTSFLLTSLAAILVNHWKQRLVEDSVALAEEHGRTVVRELASLMEEERTNHVEKLRANPRAHSSIQLLLKHNEHIVMAAFVDSRGAMILEHYQGEETSGTAVLLSGGQYTAKIPPSRFNPALSIRVKNPSDNLRELDFPVMKGDQILGQLRLSVSENSILKRISYSSSLISKSLVILHIALFLLLLLTYFFLWRFFSHHLALVEERDRLDKLAAIGTLASGLAHEIRNPLNAMNVNLEVIQEEMEDPHEDSRRKNMEILINLRREIEQLNRTLSSFMKFALPGKMEMQDLDFVTLLRETLEFFAAEFDRESIAVQTNMPEKCSLKADSTSLKQLIMNLIVNAVQAMKKSRKKMIQIELVPEVRIWHLTVRDTGAGFGDLDPEKCFEVFFTTKKDGVGFGLPIARQIASQHRGRLWAENASPEPGARFHLTIPMD